MPTTLGGKGGIDSSSPIDNDQIALSSAESQQAITTSKEDVSELQADVQESLRLPDPNLSVYIAYLNSNAQYLTNMETLQASIRGNLDGGLLAFEDQLALTIAQGVQELKNLSLTAGKQEINLVGTVREIILQDPGFQAMALKFVSEPIREHYSYFDTHRNALTQVAMRDKSEKGVPYIGDNQLIAEITDFAMNPNFDPLAQVDKRKSLLMRSIATGTLSATDPFMDGPKGNKMQRILYKTLKKRVTDKDEQQHDLSRLGNYRLSTGLVALPYGRTATTGRELLHESINLYITDARLFTYVGPDGYDLAKAVYNQRIETARSLGLANEREFPPFGGLPALTSDEQTNEHVDYLLSAY